jgi:predicted dehydrogenase
VAPTVALIGASGHGLWHRRTIAPLHDAGRLELVGLCDVRPIEPAPEAPVPDGCGLFDDHRELLRVAGPEVVVICTPPHTHLGIAVDALRAGADVLLEKPPLLSLEEHRTLSAVLAETGRVCQVGFQALGSAALTELTAAIGAGRLGTVTGIGVAGSWQRDDSYYLRSPWAGRRSVDGRPVLDGALANAFAHALMQCLAIAAAATDKATPTTVELERYRARPIEVDDTACLRVTLDGGLPVVVAVTLCGEDFIAGEITVDGTAGQAVLEYPTDTLRLCLSDPHHPAHRSSDGAMEVRPGRVGLLTNLLDHRADPAGAPLIAPLWRTEAFTAVLEVIQAAPEPTLIPEGQLVISGATPARSVTVTGVNDAIRQAAAKRELFCELSVPWATTPYRSGLQVHCK